MTAANGENDRAEFGRRVRAARAYANQSRGELATALGLSPSSLQRLEDGDRDIKPLEAEALLPKLVRLTGLPADWFDTADYPAPRSDDRSPELVAINELGDDLRRLLAEVLAVVRQTGQEIAEPHGLAETLRGLLPPEEAGTRSPARKRDGTR